MEVETTTTLGLGGQLSSQLVSSRVRETLSQEMRWKVGGERTGHGELDGSLVRSVDCSCRGSEVSSQHPRHVPLSLLALQLQEDTLPLALTGPALMHRHIIKIESWVVVGGTHL